MSLANKFNKIRKVVKMTTLEKIKAHEGHMVINAFNEIGKIKYCPECSCDFHGCYCDDVENCPNCWLPVDNF